MDVVGGESSGMPGQLLVLLPGLFVLQGWQVYMGVQMMVQTGQAVVSSEGWLVRGRPCMAPLPHGACGLSVVQLVA